MCGSGYLSGTVMRFNLLKSPQGRQSLGSFLGTKCSGEQHGELEGLHIPAVTRNSNSALAILNFVGSSLLGFVYGSWPFVITWCTVLCLTGML